MRDSLDNLKSVQLVVPVWDRVVTPKDGEDDDEDSGEDDDEDSGEDDDKDGGGATDDVKLRIASFARVRLEAFDLGGSSGSGGDDDDDGAHPGNRITLRFLTAVPCNGELPGGGDDDDDE